jgi:hypothetical protein
MQWGIKKSANARQEITAIRATVNTNGRAFFGFQYRSLRIAPKDNCDQLSGNCGENWNGVSWQWSRPPCVQNQADSLAEKKKLLQYHCYGLTNNPFDLENTNGNLFSIHDLQLYIA